MRSQVSVRSTNIFSVLTASMVSVVCLFSSLQDSINNSNAFTDSNNNQLLSNVSNNLNSLNLFIRFKLCSLGLTNFSAINHFSSCVTFDVDVLSNDKLNPLAELKGVKPLAL